MGAKKSESRFIGEYFRQYLKVTGFSRQVLIKKLGFNYARNEKMLCDYLNKRDYLWKVSEVEMWCEALRIKNTTTIYSKLIERAGKNDK